MWLNNLLFSIYLTAFKHHSTIITDIHESKLSGQIYNEEASDCVIENFWISNCFTNGIVIHTYITVVSIVAAAVAISLTVVVAFIYNFASTASAVIIKNKQQQNHYIIIASEMRYPKGAIISISCSK